MTDRLATTSSAFQGCSARIAMLATLPLLAACSSSPGGYPTVADLARSAHTSSVAAAPTIANAAPVARPVVYGPPLMGTSSAGTTLAGISPPGFVPPSEPQAMLPPPPPPPSPAEQASQNRAKEADESLASAYPSVALFNRMRDDNKPARTAAPVVSDMPASAAVASAGPASGQAAPPSAQPASAQPAGGSSTPAAPASSDNDAAWVSAYPSQSIFGTFHKSSN